MDIRGLKGIRDLKGIRGLMGKGNGMNQRIDGSELTIGVHYEPSGVDPHIGAAELALQMTNAVFDTLVNKTLDGDYLPGLAKRFDISADECTYRFFLRDDVCFHDGTPFNAAAVKFSLDRACDPANQSQLAGSLLGPYRCCRLIDDYTLEVELASPYALLLDALSQGWLAPVSPAAVERLGDGFARAPVGTGPFIFEEWLPGDCITLVRNPDYRWAPPQVDNRGAAHLQKITFKFLRDDDARSDALESGEVDVIFFTPPGDAARLRANPAFRIDTCPIRGVPVCMMMNIAKAPTDDLAVRRAISYAIDRPALIDEVFHDEFVRAYGPVSQFTLGYESIVENFYPFDPAKARELLDAAGWLPGEDGVRERNGVKLRVDFYALPVNFYPQFGSIISRQLAEIGIRVEVTILDPVSWIKAGMRGDHHLIPQGKYASSSQFLSFVYHSRHSGPDGYGWSKRGAAHNPRLDRLLDRAEGILKPENFIPLLNKAQTIIMEDALAVPLHCNTNIVASRREVRGIRFDAIGAYPYFHDTVIYDGVNADEMDGEVAQ